MSKHQTDRFHEIREGVRSLCANFSDEYFRKVDAERGYPESFVVALIQAGWLSAMIPEEYGGSGLGLTAATVIMEEINRCGGNSGAVHGQMYNMGTLLRSGSPEQKEKYLFKRRNDYTHKAGFRPPAGEWFGGSIGSPVQEFFASYWTSTRTHDWPGVLERAVRAGRCR